jgi:hypothetical protein
MQAIRLDVAWRCRVSAAVLFVLYFLSLCCHGTSVVEETMVQHPKNLRHRVTEALSLGNHSQIPSPQLQLVNQFPSLEDCTEMAALSGLVYSFKNEQDDEHVCSLVNMRIFNNSRIFSRIPPSAFREDLHCHWYLHDRDEGSQVMILSSASQNYMTVVFAGTDDVETALIDVNVLTEPYGDGVNYTLPDPQVLIHAGFNQAVFQHTIYQRIETELDRVRLQMPHARIFTTGHSLGAAESILAAIQLTRHLQEQDQQQSTLVASEEPPVPTVTSISFGCPQTGRYNWDAFVHTNPIVHNLSIWRLVLGWDLVPRLPTGFHHVGHTVQLNAVRSSAFNTSDRWNKTAQAYYQHTGDINLNYAGVPLGWSAKPYIWVPGALFAHFISKYWSFLDAWASVPVDQRDPWVSHFEVLDSNNTSGNHTIFNTDDDVWIQPPDDWMYTTAADSE